MKMGMLALGSMGTVSVLLWDSPKEWIGHLLKAGGGAQQAGDGSSQGFRSLEVGRLSVHTWLHLTAYLASTLSHFLRKKSCISWNFGDHSDVVSARDFQEKPKENLIYQRMMKSKFCSVMELFCLTFLFSYWFSFLSVSMCRNFWLHICIKMLLSANQKTILEC